MIKQKVETIGPWIRCLKLGQGGNGEAWRCRHKSDGRIAAVKFLKRIRLNSVVYRRFSDEIKLMRGLAHKRGILPLLQSNLPPEESNPPDIPWLAMPEVRSLKNGFPYEISLDRIVVGFSNVATVLSELAEEGIHHRDIKPQNLFIYNEEIVIGDFGLATYPDKEALTVEGSKLGPLYYIAPEMLEYKKGVDESRADVYSLAKTLWVLVTGQKYPPPGEQQATERAIAVSNYVSHPKSYLLDRLIESATYYDPSKRINLSDFAAELGAWAKLGPSPVADIKGNILDLDNRLQTALLPVLSKEEKEREHRRLFEESKKTLISPLQKLRETLPDLDNVTISLGENLALRGTLGINLAESYPLEGPAIVLCGPGKKHRPLMFSSLGLFDRGEEKTSLVAHHVVIIEQVTDPEVVWSESIDVILGGSTLNLAIHQLIQGLSINFRKAFQRYTELIERYRDVIE